MSYLLYYLQSPIIGMQYSSCFTTHLLRFTYNIFDHFIIFLDGFLDSIIHKITLGVELILWGIDISLMLLLVRSIGLPVVPLAPLYWLTCMASFKISYTNSK